MLGLQVSHYTQVQPPAPRTRARPALPPLSSTRVRQLAGHDQPPNLGSRQRSGPTSWRTAGGRPSCPPEHGRVTQWGVLAHLGAAPQLVLGVLHCGAAVIRHVLVTEWKHARVASLATVKHHLQGGGKVLIW